MQDRLRPLWDFDDLERTEERLRAQLDAERTEEGRAEVLAELARVHGLRREFTEGDALLDEATRLAGEGRAARARIDLERGRLRRSSGDPEAARPLFESAYTLALDAGHGFVAADAAHMVALVTPEPAGFVDWTERGIALAEQDADASYWLGPLLNNLGWKLYEAGDFAPALDAFQSALRAREREPEKRGPIEIARFAVGKTLRALGRADEAIHLLEHAVAWSQASGKPDGWFHEELAEEYAAAGRLAEAQEQAAVAIPLLERDDPAFAEDAERRARLAFLAGAP